MFEEIQTIRKEIQKGEIENALESATKLFEEVYSLGKIRDDLLLISAKFSALNHDIIRGFVPREVGHSELTKITFQFLGLLKKAEEVALSNIKGIELEIEVTPTLEVKEESKEEMVFPRIGEHEPGRWSLSKPNLTHLVFTSVGALEKMGIEIKKVRASILPHRCLKIDFLPVDLLDLSPIEVGVIVNGINLTGLFAFDFKLEPSPHGNLYTFRVFVDENTSTKPFEIFSAYWQYAHKVLHINK